MKTKIKIFVTYLNKHQETETTIQSWLDSFDSNGHRVEIEHVSQICVDNNLIHIIMIYKEVPK